MKTTSRRDRATAFASQLDAHVAIMTDKPGRPGAIYSVRRYPDQGFFVLVLFANGGNGWLIDA
jgi:hypothetical protein